MKNEDLYVYKKSDFYEDYIFSQKEYYEREQVDALIAEKDKEIAELKKKLMPCLNGDCILTCEVVEKYGKENAELKQKLHDTEMRADIAEAANTEYRIDLKNIKDNIAKHARNQYHKHNRQTLRALWLARANDASSFAGLFSTLSDIEDDETRTYWIFGNKRKIVFDGLKCRRMETAYKWFCIWDDVANKCLKKAEEYR